MGGLPLLQQLQKILKLLEDGLAEASMSERVKILSSQPNTQILDSEEYRQILAKAKQEGEEYVAKSFTVTKKLVEQLKAAINSSFRLNPSEISLNHGVLNNIKLKRSVIDSAIKEFNEKIQNNDTNKKAVKDAFELVAMAVCAQRGRWKTEYTASAKSLAEKLASEEMQEFTKYTLGIHPPTVKTILEHMKKIAKDHGNPNLSEVQNKIGEPTTTNLKEELNKQKNSELGQNSRSYGS